MRVILLKSKIHRCTVRVQSRRNDGISSGRMIKDSHACAAHGGSSGGNPPSRWNSLREFSSPPAAALTPQGGAPGVRFPSR